MASTSSSIKAERTLRLIIKLAQLIASLYLIISMYNIGPHWILLVASLAVPLYGLFLLFRSPERTLRQHPLPYVRYKALARARSWLRVDVAICATMGIVCLAFALVLLLGYFQEHSANTFLLQAAIAALLLALLYSLNCLLNIRQLQMGQVDFLLEKQNASISTTRASTQSPIGEPNFAERPASSMNGHSSPYRVEFEESWHPVVEKPMPTVSIQSPPSSIERQGPSLLEQLQKELAAEYANGRWRHIPIEVSSEGETMEQRQKVERQVKVEQRRTDKFGMDLGAFGTKEEKWTNEGEEMGANGRGLAEGKMLPRLAVQKNGGSSRIRGEWSGAVCQKKGQWENPAPPFPAANSSSFSSSSGENGIGHENNEARRTVERKRVRYETVTSKTLVDVDKGKEPIGEKESSIIGGKLRPRRDFNVSIRPRTSPFRHSTELRLRDDRRRAEMAHQITEL